VCGDDDIGGRGGAADPLDVLLGESYEPSEAVLLDEKGEEIGNCVIVVRVGEDKLAFPLGVGYFCKAGRDVVCGELGRVVVEGAEAVCIGCQSRSW
jgi:hypothetical protein